MMNMRAFSAELRELELVLAESMKLLLGELETDDKKWQLIMYLVSDLQQWECRRHR